SPSGPKRRLPRVPRAGASLPGKGTPDGHLATDARSTRRRPAVARGPGSAPRAPTFSPLLPPREQVPAAECPSSIGMGLARYLRNLVGFTLASEGHMEQNAGIQQLLTEFRQLLQSEEHTYELQSLRNLV